MTDTKKPDGGPAFPWTEVDACKDCSALVSPPRGMSMRDWFAGQAIAGMRLPPDYSKGPCNAAAAERAYAMADAMLAERERGSEG